MLSEELIELAEEYQKQLNEIQSKEEEFWTSLSGEQKLASFNCVIRRLYDAELVQNCTYRQILNDVFGFGIGAYTRAMHAGFQEIHNSIYTKQRLRLEIKQFLLDADLRVDDVQINSFLGIKDE